MRKKLLTILVSVFMIMATFAVNVFADEPANIEQLFNTYAPNFPKEIDSTVPDKAWISSNNICYISQDNNLCFDSGSGYSSLPVTEEISRIVDTNNFKCNYFNIIFNIENDKLISIERNYTEESSSLNGIYTAKVTIADILPNDFPTTSASGWVAQDGSRIYVDVDGDNLISSVTMPLSSVVTSDDDNYSISPSFGWTFIFVMESGVLSRIDKQPLGLTVSYYPYAYTNPSISKPVGYTEDIEFVTNGKYEGQSITPVTVKIDGGDPLTYGTQFEVSAGSTHVKLKGSYVSTLAIGTHTIEIGMTSDDPIKSYDPITSEFTITDAPSPAPTPDPTPKYEIPNTGVEATYSNNHSLLKLSSLSLLALGTYLVVKKKKDN